MGRELLQALAELIGTFFFLFTAFSGAAAARRQSSLTGASGAQGGDSDYMTAAISFGFGLMVACWVTLRISGGALNPAVVLALALVRAMPLRKAALYIVAQICGGFLATGLVTALNPGSFLGANALTPGVSRAQVMFLEAIMTALLCLVVLFLAYEKHSSTMLAPTIIGLTVWVSHIVLIPYDGCSINPARAMAGALGQHNWHDMWIFVLGPFIGSFIAAGIFAFFKHFKYEQLVNPYADIDALYLHQVADPRGQRDHVLVAGRDPDGPPGC
ncbi:hypothetical protein CXG81DRAFT_14914 [Caulochytrium protostelioides]|uniref:Aquaporin-like protein n=1 Tax=Caulochytrium protostelioides TaxID=1555241 RepID=A0A4P9X2S0_9FUNG|nr:hypothetical protein CXG81DRAFT_14914 [Caulochytrium protostelioides]|eukprot:RKO99160.1 hypothetical protein CXG81DRAFT_14914 [Caulochytrium protostelioides]